MNLSHRTVLITGGASGIGLALAQRLHARGCTVIVCGRRADRLAEAAAALPGLFTWVCDLTDPAERALLAVRVVAEHPELDVVIHNAGIQNRLRFDVPGADWAAMHTEITTNLDAPIHLTQLLLPHLLARPDAAIVNVTSGLAFAPAAFAPVYSATKAALHSFTLSLRHQLRETSVRVLELVPPAVNTDLGGPGLHTFGEPVDAFVDAVLPRFEAGEVEVGYAYSEAGRLAGRAETDALFARINTPR